LFNLTEGLGTSQFLMFAARKATIDKNRAAMVDLMEDMIRIERWYLDPKNQDDVRKVASDLVKQPPERFGWLFTGKDYYRDPNMAPDLAALQRNVDLTAEMGFISSHIDVKQHSDLSLIEEAAKRLQ
jgi:NitT/TauT family transport system substrate-binding protein